MKNVQFCNRKVRSSPFWISKSDHKYDNTSVEQQSYIIILMTKCKLCCLDVTRCMVIIGLVNFFLMVINLGVDLGHILNQLRYYKFTPFQQFDCQQLCEITGGFEDAAVCCNPAKTQCIEKASCLNSKVDYYNYLADEQKRSLIMWCSISILAIVLSVFIWGKLGQLQRNIQARMYANDFGREGGNFAERYDGQIQKVPLLLQSFIAQEAQRENICVICYMEFQESKVVKLKCGHLYHRPCIEKWMEKSNRCPLCKKQQA